MISIIVPARNGAPMTASCLRAAFYTCQALQLEAQFVLVDDASDADENLVGVFRDAKKEIPGLPATIIRARSRLHYTGAFATGLHFAEAENVLFLSNDMALTPHFLLALLGVASLSNHFGIIRGTSNWPDSHPEHRVESPPFSNYGEIARFSAQRFEKLGLAFAEDRLLSGDAVLIKRAVITTIGVPDCRFFGYFGDIDYGMRAHLAGFKLVCAKGAWLQHQGAGHLRIDAARSGRPMAELEAERMKLVGEAYEVFRQKWDPSLPASVADVDFNDYNALSEKAPLRPDLKCVVPQAILDNLAVE